MNQFDIDKRLGQTDLVGALSDLLNAFEERALNENQINELRFAAFEKRLNVLEECHKELDQYSIETRRQAFALGQKVQRNF